MLPSGIELLTSHNSFHRIVQGLVIKELFLGPTCGPSVNPLKGKERLWYKVELTVVSTLGRSFQED